MKFFSIATLILAVFLFGCAEPTERIENKLTDYLQDDLKFMVAETMKASKSREGLLDTPYYRVKDFRLFDGAEARIYAAYAEVDFFIYKDISMHEKRKYRSVVNNRCWDRYKQELKLRKDTLG